MNAKSKNIKSNLKQVDSHIIQDDEYDELPEITEEMFGRAVYKIEGIEKPAPRRVKQKTPTTVAISLKLPPEVVQYFKSEGTEWQTKVGNILKEWVKTHPHHR